MRRRPIGEVLADHAGELLSQQAVVGVAEGTTRGRPCVVVLVAKPSPELATRLPAELESYPVIVRETGSLRALD